VFLDMVLVCVPGFTLEPSGRVSSLTQHSPARYYESPDVPIGGAEYFFRLLPPRGLRILGCGACVWVLSSWVLPEKPPDVFNSFVQHSPARYYDSLLTQNTG